MEWDRVPGWQGRHGTFKGDICRIHPLICSKMHEEITTLSYRSLLCMYRHESVELRFNENYFLVKPVFCLFHSHWSLWQLKLFIFLPTTQSAFTLHIIIYPFTPVHMCHKHSYTCSHSYRSNLEINWFTQGHAAQLSRGSNCRSSDWRMTLLSRAWWIYIIVLSYLKLPGSKSALL